ncbi:MAG TPA: hypothetical protein DEA96_16095 [Leptospiraceae bacterium]|nr:hypothetical protein [Spirochaetaceae bacterium]HBS06491.1 hypothetical protein [Leptospiraceae bacterium]|tara:strand:- start:191 stop:568 length:378 start_codon:yes stop_codon:yes gene_type:complete
MAFLFIAVSLSITCSRTCQKDAKLAEMIQGNWTEDSSGKLWSIKNKKYSSISITEDRWIHFSQKGPCFYEWAGLRRVRIKCGSMQPYFHCDIQRITDSELWINCDFGSGVGEEEIYYSRQEKSCL